MQDEHIPKYCLNCGKIGHQRFPCLSPSLHHVVPTPIRHGDWLQAASYTSKLNWMSERKFFLEPPSHAGFSSSPSRELKSPKLDRENFERGESSRQVHRSLAQSSSWLSQINNVVGFLEAIVSDRSNCNHLHGHVAPRGMSMELVTHSGLVGANGADLPLILVLEAYPGMSAHMDLDQLGNQVGSFDLDSGALVPHLIPSMLSGPPGLAYFHHTVRPCKFKSTL